MSKRFKQHIDFVIDAHASAAKTPDKMVRLWDRKTPYSIHPLWCAMTLATETTLPLKPRTEGVLVLLYHDVLEDSTMQLPADIPLHVVQSIQDMTFHEGIRQEMEEIWKKDPFIRLLKLYDKVSNLLDASWMDADLYERYSRYTQKLLIDVEKNYGQLNIVKIAHAIIGTP